MSSESLFIVHTMLIHCFLLIQRVEVLPASSGMAERETTHPEETEIWKFHPWHGPRRGKNRS
jgi:hypothetical protein